MNILQQIAALLGGKLTKVHEKTVANKEAIEDEVRRAKASETLLDTNIKNETKRAQEEETRIELKAVDLVNAEETRATKAESDLSTKIDTDVKAEADRAKGAEQAIIGNLNAETARAKAAEKANSDAITSLDEKKVDKVEGKQLSTEDYTTAEKTKVGNLGKYTTSDIYERVMAGSQDMYLEYKVKNPETGEIQTYDTILHKVSDTHNGLMTPAQKLVIDNLLSGDSALSILGTPSQTWQLNLGSGPKLKNSGGVFELRNAADNAYADLTVNALTIKGNVTQEGGSFITQAETVSAKDNTILLNSGETGAGVTKGIAGVEIDRGTLPKYEFIFDESDDRFKAGSEGDLWSVMLRDNESDLTDKGILTWDATTKRAKTAFNIDDLADTYLPLAGGTMTGPLYLDKGGASIAFTGENNAMEAMIAYANTGASGIPPTFMVGGFLSGSELHFISQGGLFHNLGNNNKYKIWTEGNDGANSGLDADLLDGQHGSYYAKATDLNSYLPLSAGSTKPITGMLCVTGYDDSFPYNGITTNIVAGSTQEPTSSILCTTSEVVFGIGSIVQGYNKWGCFYKGTSPDDVNICATIDDKDDWHIWGNLAIDGEITKYGGSVVATEEDINKLLPLSAGMDKPLTGVLYVSGMGGAGRRGINITSGTVTSSDSGVEFISREGVMGMGMVQDEGASIWVGTSQDDTHTCATIDNSDRWSFPNGIYIQGSKGATLEDLSGYLPLSAGSSKSLTGVLYVQGAVNNGPNGFSIGAVVGNPSSVTSYGIETAVSGTSFGMGADSASNAGYFWIGGNSASEKSYFATVSRAGKVMDFLNRPTFGGVGLAKLSEVPTNGSLFRYYTITVGGDSNHFYPCTWLNGSTTSYVSIHSRGAAGTDPYNQNQITFLASLNGWSDMPKNLRVLESDLYTYSEVTIHSIYAGNENGNNCIYLRGGLTYYVWSNVTITPNVNGFTGGNESFGIMDSSYNVITAYATKMWTYENGITVAYAKRGAALYLADAGAPDTNNIQLAYAGNGLEPSQVTHILAFDNRETGTTKLARDFTIDKLKTRLGSLPNPQSITFTGAATGTYNGSSALTINIPTQTSLAWGNITGKPSFATVATSGSYNDLSNKPSIPSIPSSLPANGGTSTYSTYLKVNDLRASAIAPTYGEQNIVGWFNNLGTPDGNWWSGIHVKGWTTAYSAWQLAGPSYDFAPASDALWFRSGKDNSWNGWKRVAFANEIPTTLPASDVYSWAKAASKPSYGWTEITGKPASMPASDVYAWAKASSKPSYAWSEITGKPTIPSLSGYATQSWVQSQGYLTNHQSLAGYVAGTKIDRTSLGALPSYSSTGIPTTSLLAYWNGAYTGTSSNLSYCSKGAFGDMCTQTASNYVNVAGAQTISGAKTFTSFVVCSAGAGTSSDIRLKKYVNRMFDAEELLSNLSGYRYVMKETDMHYAGLIAQEVQEVLPEAVREDENGFLTVDTYPIVAALVEANKAKDNRIKALEDRITTLEKKMNMILNKLG